MIKESVVGKQLIGTVLVSMNTRSDSRLFGTGTSWLDHVGVLGVGGVIMTRRDSGVVGRRALTWRHGWLQNWSTLAI